MKMKSSLSTTQRFIKDDAGAAHARSLGFQEKSMRGCGGRNL
jgi:hypothetical protein